MDVACKVASGARWTQMEQSCVHPQGSGPSSRESRPRCKHYHRLRYVRGSDSSRHWIKKASIATEGCRLSTSTSWLPCSIQKALLYRKRRNHRAFVCWPLGSLLDMPLYLVFKCMSATRTSQETAMFGTEFAIASKFEDSHFEMRLCCYVTSSIIRLLF